MTDHHNYTIHSINAIGEFLKPKPARQLKAAQKTTPRGARGDKTTRQNPSEAKPKDK